MKQFISLQDAKKTISKYIKPKHDFLYAPLENALGKICAEDFIATLDAPSFSQSAMDGYAIFHDNATEKLDIVGSIFAGDFAEYILQLGTCYKIMTGAMLPSGCTAVVPFEEALASDEASVNLPLGIAKYANCRLRASEFKKGKPLCSEGDTITAGTISLLASQGITHIKVRSPLKIAVLSSGDEIIDPWSTIEQYGVFNSNTITIKMLLQSYGFEADYKGVFPDNLEKSVQFIQALQGYDVIITTGGVSMGEADFVGEAFVQNDMTPIFHKVNIKPGKPILFGQMPNTDVFALPGNPMSSFLNTMLFVVPALFQKIGATNRHLSTQIATNQASFSLSQGKGNIVLGTLQNGVFHATKDNHYNSGMHSPMSDSNAIAIFSGAKKQVEEGEAIKAILLNSALVATATSDENH